MQAFVKMVQQLHAFVKVYRGISSFFFCVVLEGKVIIEYRGAVDFLGEYTGEMRICKTRYHGGLMVVVRLSSRALN